MSKTKAGPISAERQAQAELLKFYVDQLQTSRVRMDAANRSIRRLYVVGKRQFGLTTEELELEIIKYREGAGRKSQADGSRVYFLRLPEKGLVKIGVTRDLDSRVRGLSGTIKSPVALVGSIDGDNVAERVIHHQLRQHREHGEFFSWPAVSDAVAGMVARNSALMPEHLQ